MGQELNFIINVLFKEKSLNFNEIKNLDLKKLIKIASYHLIIPLLYVKLKMVKPTVEKNKPKITLWPFLNINFRCSNVYTTKINKGNSAGNSSMLSKNSP